MRALGNAFEEDGAGAGGAPLAGAAVKLAAMDAEGSCPRLWPTQLPSGAGNSHPEATTDAAGNYRVTTYYPGPSSKGTLVLCVRRDGYEPYEYVVVDHESSDPKYGEKPLNIRVKAAPKPKLLSPRGEREGGPAAPGEREGEPAAPGERGPAAPDDRER